MKKTFVFSAILIIIIASTTVLLTKYDVPASEVKKQEIYVGVAYCGNSVEAGKQLIDKIKGYTNLFVLQSGTLERDLNSVTELGDYAVSAGLYFLPYFGSYLPPTFPLWLQNATQRWGSHLLGVYYDDEPGGKMLDNYAYFKDAAGDSIIKTSNGDIEVEMLDGVNILYQFDGIINVFEPANVTENSGSNGLAINETGDLYVTFYSNGTINVAEANVLTPTSEDVI